MIARFPKLVSRSIAATLIASSLALGGASFAQILPGQVDPSTVYGWITIDQSGGLVTANTDGYAVIEVPAENLFAGRTPSVSADGSLMDQNLKLTALNAEGITFTVESIKLVRSGGDEGPIGVTGARDTLQIELSVNTTGPLGSNQLVQFTLENATSGNAMTFNVQVIAQ